jgi:resuscitation-promoting factor RpfB
MKPKQSYRSLRSVHPFALGPLSFTLGPFTLCPLPLVLYPLSCAAVLLLSACSTVFPAPTPTTPADVTLTLTADGKTQTVTLSPELTVREALAHAGLSLGELDRLSPPPYTRIAEGMEIKIIRVTETFETEQAIVPFTSQVVKNEGIPEGQRRLIQAGANGLEEITYRTVFEDGVQISRSIVKRVYLQPPVPEITMVGAQASFTIIPITGTLAYLNGHNAWIIRQNSGQRRPVTFTGDLDGRIFDLSPDGSWLLYDRVVTDTNSPQFNTLWAVPLTATVTNTVPIALPISNTLYAEWSPTQSRTVVYSTAEKIVRAPGWQANNDLWLTSWDEQRNRVTRKTETVFTTTLMLDTSSGGLYGWWGTGFAFSPDGSSIAYARTDSVGLFDLATQTETELTQFAAFNSHSDWAWFPSLGWSPEGQFLYTVTHGQPLGLELPEDSPVFNVTVLQVFDPFQSLQIDLVPRAGMFANPLPSPVQASANAESPYRIAFLQAVEPNNSSFSRYRLGVMDRDGSNVRFIFPPEDQPGLNATETALAWSPDGRWLALIYEGNLWLLDPDSGLSQQLTGDGLSEHPEWGK